MNFLFSGKLRSSGTKRSATQARHALKMTEMSLSHSDSALGTLYRRLCGRMDKPRANTTTAHKFARMMYFLLTRAEAFVHHGQQHHEEQQRQRSVAAPEALCRRARLCGHNRRRDRLKSSVNGFVS